MANRISTGEGILAVVGGLGRGFIQGRQQKRQELIQEKEQAELEKERKRLEKEKLDRRIKTNAFINLLGNPQAPPEELMKAGLLLDIKPEQMFDIIEKRKAMFAEPQAPQTVTVGNQEIPLDQLHKFGTDIEKIGLGIKDESKPTPSTQKKSFEEKQLESQIGNLNKQILELQTGIFENPDEARAQLEKLTRYKALLNEKRKNKDFSELTDEDKIFIETGDYNFVENKKAIFNKVKEMLKTLPGSSQNDVIDKWKKFKR